MTFKCPACAVNTLIITRSIDLPPDAHNDELTLQIVQCGSCQFHGAAVYEESRRGPLDSESWRHHGYQLSDADWEALVAAINRCPAPRNEGCACATHVSLCKVDDRHNWDGLRQNGIELKNDFKMQYVPEP
jgi:hypothetical protein